jgi:hypothetical protein
MRFGPPQPLNSSLLLNGAGPSNGGSVPANSAEAQQFYDRLFTPPASGSAEEMNYNTFIDGLVADGVWTLLDQISLFFAGSTEGDTLINLKSGTYNATRADASGHAVWTQHQYYDQGGTLRSITSNFNPSTASGANFTRNNHGFGVWIANATQYDSTAIDCGVWTDGAGFNNPWSIAVIPKWSNGHTFWNAGGSYVDSAGVTDSSGFFWVQRTGANAASLYYNNALHASDTSASVALPNAEIYAPVKHRTRAMIIGVSLTPTQRTALYDRLTTLVTTVTGGVP